MRDYCKDGAMEMLRGYINDLKEVVDIEGYYSQEAHRLFGMCKGILYTIYQFRNIGTEEFDKLCAVINSTMFDY